MFYEPIKATTYKVTSSSSTLKDRQTYAQQTAKYEENVEGDNQSIETTVTWSGPERRTGNDRRIKNGVTQQRLDARNRIDRRASKLSIAI